MRKSRFSDEPIVKILREADRETAAAAAKSHAVSEQAIYPVEPRIRGRREGSRLDPESPLETPR